MPQGLKPRFLYWRWAARLKPCPDTNRDRRGLRRALIRIAIGAGEGVISCAEGMEASGAKARCFIGAGGTAEAVP